MTVHNPPPSSGGTPASPDTSFQFNDGGVFGGNANAKFDKTTGQSLFGQPTEEGFRVEILGRTVAANCSGTPDACATFPSAEECNNQEGCVSNMSNCNTLTTSEECAGEPSCTSNQVDCASLYNASNSAPCTAQTGCTPASTGDCHEFDGNQGQCEGHEGCAFADDLCSGSYYSSCDGGEVFSDCSGTFFVNCSGTPDACDTFVSQGTCVAQTSCVWTTAVTKGAHSVGVNKWQTNFAPTNFSDLSLMTSIEENTNTSTGAIADVYTFGGVVKAGRLVDKDGNTDFYVGSTQIMRLNTSGHVVVGGTAEPTPGGVSPQFSVTGTSDVKQVINVTTANGFSAFVVSGSGNTGTPYFEAQARFSNTAASNTFGFNFNRDSGPTFVGIINMNGAGQVNIGSSFSGWLTLHAGGTAASSAPIKFISASLMTSAEIGADEFLTDKRYFTITTGTARKEYTFNDTALTSGRVPFVTTNGRLTDDADMTFATDTLTVTKIVTTSLQTDAIVNDTGLAAGVYTPTRSAEVNMDANVTMFEAQYMRVGNTVTVSGRFTADPTLTATATSFEMTLPVASNIGAVEDLAGVAFCGSVAGMGAQIEGVVANDTMKVFWVSSDITSKSWSFTATYQVI